MLQGRGSDFNPVRLTLALELPLAAIATIRTRLNFSLEKELHQQLEP